MTSSFDKALIVLTPESAAAMTRAIAVEAPVAIEVNGIGYAVMMMTPEALDAFATGFMLTERLADSAADILDMDCFESERGWIVRVTLAEACAGRIHDRVRHRSSDTGCGLCGISGLEQVMRPLARPAPLPRVGKAALFAALGAIRDHQPINRATGAVHAAALCDDQGAVVRAFEDVGRHNALDKLIGSLAIDRVDIAGGFLLVTSRISFEMVDKALIAGAPLLAGISAPTTMAIAHAEAHGLTLAALARRDAILLLNDPGGVFASGSGGGT
ncbi:formate dehydrogenase accessory sulfurtransferase FdhD [Sphingomonas koreensis]|nr:formate dehydrogenase accessory sulfurtransferase FdhD [Sphingomonas koreensis]